jgi:hypothetical protein
MARTKLVLPVIAATALGLVTACGSTVQTANTPAGTTSDSLAVPGSTASSAAAGGLSVPTAGGAAAAAGGPAATSGGTAAAGTGLSGSASTSPGSAPITSGGGSSGLVPSRAPGVTSSKVYLGIGYSSQTASADRAIGASGAAPSYDSRNVVNAVIDYANKHGGFAGRQAQAIFFNVNLTEDKNTQDQAACAQWTQDNKVALIESDASTILDACAEKAGAVSAGTGTGATFRQYPHLIDSDGIALERLGSATASGLYRAHYFAGKLGLLTWDDPRYRATISDGYMPFLNSHGIKVWDTRYIAVPQQVGAIADMSAAVSSAVTRFRAEGIDHVIIQDGPAGVWAGTGLTLEFMNQAKSQHYYPRYGENAYNSPGWSGLPSDEMNNALAVSDTDSDAKYDKGWHTNQARVKCFKIEADAGYPVHSDNVEDEGLAAQYCDMILLFQRAMNHVSVISSDSLVQAVAGFGTSLESAFVYGTKFFPGRRDGSDMMRSEIYKQSCQCLQFLGKPYWAG